MSTRHAFVVDVNKCTGCDACTIACQIANGLPASRDWREVHTFNELHVPGVELIHLSLACNHCREAPCMQQCPALAYSRDETTGAVLINDQACIGCGYCSWVCPYGAPRMDEERGVMTKCNMCNDKVLAGGQPACVTSCPTEALAWHELAQRELTQNVPGFADAGTAPGIKVVGVESERRVPRQTSPPVLPPWQDLQARIKPRITLVHEWQLAVFTSLVAVLAGVLTGSRFGGPAVDWWLFLGVGVAGMGLSAGHLGHLERAWRAPLHAHRSWLSREVVLFSAFLALGTVVVAQPAWVPWLPLCGWLAVGLSAGLLIVVDRVYGPARLPGPGPLHSAEVVGTGLLVAAVWARIDLVVITVAVLKVVLFVTRRGALGSVGLAVPRLGFLIAGVGNLLLGGGLSWPIAVMILGGELIDRAWYYQELEIPTPNSLMLDELAVRPEARGIFEEV